MVFVHYYLLHPSLLNVGMQANSVGIKFDAGEHPHHTRQVNPLTIFMKVIAAVLALCCLVATGFLIVRAKHIFEYL